MSTQDAADRLAAAGSPGSNTRWTENCGLNPQATSWGDALLTEEHWGLLLRVTGQPVDARMHWFGEAAVVLSQQGLARLLDDLRRLATGPTGPLTLTAYTAPTASPQILLVDVSVSVNWIRWQMAGLFKRDAPTAYSTHFSASLLEDLRDCLTVEATLLALASTTA